MATLKKPCPHCAGRGVVPRTRPTIEGRPDPFGTRTEELCARCGGSGAVPDAGPTRDAEAALPAIDPGDYRV
jgi:DnaJ-class molecular chaperone